MTPTPRLRRYIPPTSAESTVVLEEQEALRARLVAAWTAGHPGRAAAIALGPELRDPGAAADCRCSCHPRPASESLHDGGRSCPCQRTQAERAAEVAVLLAATVDHGVGDDGHRAGRAERIATAVAELDVEIDEIGGMAPFVITGRVDGRGFYLRERHDIYTVVVAPDTNPTADVWRGPAEIDRVEITRGCSDDLDTEEGFDEVRALTVAVDQVRLYLLRRACAHLGAARFCPACGIEVSQSARWTDLS